MDDQPSPNKIRDVLGQDFLAWALNGSAEDQFIVQFYGLAQEVESFGRPLVPVTPAPDFGQRINEIRSDHGGDIPERGDTDLRAYLKQLLVDSFPSILIYYQVLKGLPSPFVKHWNCLLTRAQYEKCMALMDAMPPFSTLRDLGGHDSIFVASSTGWSGGIQKVLIPSQLLECAVRGATLACSLSLDELLRQLDLAISTWSSILRGTKTHRAKVQVGLRGSAIEKPTTTTDGIVRPVSEYDLFAIPPSARPMYYGDGNNGYLAGMVIETEIDYHVAWKTAPFPAGAAEAIRDMATPLFHSLGKQVQSLCANKGETVQLQILV